MGKRKEKKPERPREIITGPCHLLELPFEIRRVVYELWFPSLLDSMILTIEQNYPRVAKKVDKSLRMYLTTLLSCLQRAYLQILGSNAESRRQCNLAIGILSLNRAIRHELIEEVAAGIIVDVSLKASIAKFTSALTLSAALLVQHISIPINYPHENLTKSLRRLPRLQSITLTHYDRSEDELSKGSRWFSGHLKQLKGIHEICPQLTYAEWWQADATSEPGEIWPLTGAIVCDSAS